METKSKRINACIRVMAAIAFLGTVFMASSLMAADVENQTITGTVVELEQDGEGNVTAAAIQTDTEDFLIVKNDNGEELMKMIEKMVEVTGAVVEFDGGKEITVNSYKLIESE